MARLGFRCHFAELALFKARLRELGAETVCEEFGADGMTLEYELPARRVADVQARISDLSRGRIAACRID